MCISALGQAHQNPARTQSSRAKMGPVLLSCSSSAARQRRPRASNRLGRDRGTPERKAASDASCGSNREALQAKVGLTPGSRPPIRCAVRVVWLRIELQQRRKLGTPSMPVAPKRSDCRHGFRSDTRLARPVAKNCCGNRAGEEPFSVTTLSATSCCRAADPDPPGGAPK